MGKKNFEQKLDEYWIKHYVTKSGHCCLCGNRGRINTAGLTTIGGILVDRETYCICPNGRSLRKSYKKQDEVR